MTPPDAIQTRARYSISILLEVCNGCKIFFIKLQRTETVNLTGIFVIIPQPYCSVMISSPIGQQYLRPADYFRSVNKLKHLVVNSSVALQYTLCLMDETDNIWALWLLSFGHLNVAFTCGVCHPNLVAALVKEIRTSRTKRKIYHYFINARCAIHTKVSSPLAPWLNLKLVKVINLAKKQNKKQGHCTREKLH